MGFQAPRGTVDILPEQAAKWRYIESILKDVAGRYHFEEIRTPIFEETELFERGVGDSTDIVQKEMYTFIDGGNRSLTLRPEGTAAVVRAYVQHKLFGLPNQPTKLYYFGPMFRYERPQAGRMRQFHQFGCEVLGSADPAVDAEVISLALRCYQELGLTSLRLVLNSLGDQESRENYRQALVTHFTPYKEELCEDCQNRLEQNPLRVLDCKRDMDHPAMKSAPSILDYLNDYSKTYFEAVKTYLDAMDIPYVIDANLVRGLDYYNHTAFEIMSEAEGFGAITTLMGGGRYNGLSEDIGGPEAPGIGFALGMERLLLALEIESIELPIDRRLDCYFVAVDEEAMLHSVKLVNDLRANGIQVDKDYQGRKFKGQFKAADRYESKYVAILGTTELEQNSVMVKEMDSGDQELVKIEELVAYLGARLGGNKNE